MWASAQAADTQTAWQQVNAWRRTHDLLLHHAGRLKACADELSYAWPPGRSPAAQAFVAYITELRTAIDKASVGAATNYTAIAGVLTSLSSAKADMAQLMQAWDSYENSPTAEKARRSSPGSSDSPEALNAQARARMSQNDQEVLESSRRFVELAPPLERQYWNPEPLGVGSSSDVSPGGGGQGLQISGNDIPPRLTAPPISPVSASDEELSLSGSPVVSRPPGALDPSGSGLTPGMLPTADALRPDLGTGAIGKVPLTRAASTADSGRAQRIGGLHGQSGGVGGITSVSPFAVGAGHGLGRVNPVGGVIEGNRPASSTSAVPLMGGARGSAAGHRDSTAALTMHWHVAEGVPPVIEPAPEQPFELGPGVIGIDR
jgi:hypothetical protein